MALRNIQVGDNLSGKTLYFTLDVENQTQLDGSTGRDGETPFITAGGYYFGQGHNSYSLGTRYYSGLYQGDPEDSRYAEWPEVEFLSVSWYSSGDHASEEGHSSEGACPDDCGLVTDIDTTAYFYQYLFIDPSEAHLTSKIYLGNQQISAIYLGETGLSKIMLGNSECRPCSFNISQYSGTDTFYFEAGQTWKDWIDQGTHFSPSDLFSYTDWGVNYEDGSLYIPSPHADVQKEDLIIDGFSYRLGRACLSPDTLIKTDNGLIEISALSVGDTLIKNNIIEKIAIHNRESYYKIILENGDIIKASNDHLFISGDKIIRTEAIEPGQILNKLKVKEIELVKEPMSMYEIKTSTNQYTLFNDIICECENI